MKLLVVGHSVVDHIFSKNSEKVSPGGIFYSTVGYKLMKKPEDKFYLITSFSENDKKYFEKAFVEFDLEYAVKYDAIPHVNLYVDGTAERREHYHSGIDTLNLGENIEWNKFNGIYINMITGSDLTGNQFAFIRENFDGPIYLDVHTLSRGIGKDQHRFFRKINNYKSYLKNVDIVQVNENELKTITPFDDLEKILLEVFEIGVELLIITKGENGVEAYKKNGEEISFPAEKVSVKHKVGCGDVFGSVFFYNYINGSSITKSIYIANKIAGLVTTFDNTNELTELNYDFIKRYIEN